jgi:plastocyanin
MMRPLTPALLVVAVLASGCADTDPEAAPGVTTSGTAASGPGGGATNDSATEVEMYAVATDLSSTPQTWFRFRPDAFQAKVGDALNVTLKSAVGNQYPHSLVIDSLNVRLGPINAGAAQSVTILLAQAGTYTFYCAESNHQQLGMFGSLTVS